MHIDNLISVDVFCNSHKIEVSFIGLLHDNGLIKVTTINQKDFLDTEQLQSLDAGMFDKMLQIQIPLVQGEMTTSYTIMFAICAVAYLIAWFVMKLLVPVYKPITDL